MPKGDGNYTKKAIGGINTHAFDKKAASVNTRTRTGKSNATRTVSGKKG